MRRPRHAAALLAGAIAASTPRAALAIGLAGAEPLPRVREEIYLVVYDRAARREHVLYAARFEPAPRRLRLALPVDAEPEVATLAGVDLPATIHALVERTEREALGRAPAVPAPWSSRGVIATPIALSPEAAPASAPAFEAGWVHDAATRGRWLAAFDVEPGPAPAVELSTPTLRASFDAASPTLRLGEPEPMAGAPGGTASSRRTRIAVLARGRAAWASPPAGVRLVREIEPSWDDVERAFDAPACAALGLRRGADRLWLTEYLDTSEQRALDRNAELAIEPLLAPRAGGDDPRAAAADDARSRPEARRPHLDRAARRGLAFAAMVALALAALIGATYRRRDGR